VDGVAEGAAGEEGGEDGEAAKVVDADCGGTGEACPSGSVCLADMCVNDGAEVEEGGEESGEEGGEDEAEDGISALTAAQLSEIDEYEKDLLSGFNGDDDLDQDDDWMVPAGGVAD
jgi:hypothetical protein